MMTIGADLEFRRRTHRARRIELVLAALHERRGACGPEGHVAPLDQAIADFTAQLRELRNDLREGAPDRRR